MTSHSVGRCHAVTEGNASVRGNPFSKWFSSRGCALLSKESLVGGEGVAGSYFAVAGNVSRKAEVGSVYHSGHRLGAEVVVEAAVVPDYPETVLFGDFIAEFFAAGDILSDDAVELFVVEVSILADVHIVIAYLKDGAFIAALVFEVPHGEGF